MSIQNRTFSFFAEEVSYLCGKSVVPLRKKCRTFAEEVSYLCGRSVVPLEPETRINPGTSGLRNQDYNQVYNQVYNQAIYQGDANSIFLPVENSKCFVQKFRSLFIYSSLRASSTWKRYFIMHAQQGNQTCQNTL